MSATNQTQPPDCSCGALLGNRHAEDCQQVIWYRANKPTPSPPPPPPPFAHRLKSYRFCPHCGEEL